MYLQFKQFGLKDIKARSLAKFVGSLDEGMQQSPADRVFTHEEISMLLRDALASRSLNVNFSKEELLAELELIEDAIKPLKS